MKSTAFFMKIGKTIPFDFVLDFLYPFEVIIKPMFGCHALYSEQKILLILRNKEDYLRDNGVWIATDKKHHESLRKKITSLRRIYLLGNGAETNWQNIPIESINFESEVRYACELIRMQDTRIGKLPAKKRKDQ